MGGKLGTKPVRYIPLSKQEIIKMIKKHSSVLHKDIEKVRKGLLELEYQCSIKHRRYIKNDTKKVI